MKPIFFADDLVLLHCTIPSSFPYPLNPFRYGLMVIICLGEALVQVMSAMKSTTNRRCLVHLFVCFYILGIGYPPMTNGGYSLIVVSPEELRNFVRS